MDDVYNQKYHETLSKLTHYLKWREESLGKELYIFL